MGRAYLVVLDSDHEITYGLLVSLFSATAWAASKVTEGCHDKTSKCHTSFVKYVEAPILEYLADEQPKGCGSYSLYEVEQATRPGMSDIISGSWEANDRAIFKGCGKKIRCEISYEFSMWKKEIVDDTIDVYDCMRYYD